MTLQLSALNIANQLGRTNADGTLILDLEDPIKAEIRNAIRHYNRMPSHLTEVRGGILNTLLPTDDEPLRGIWYSTVDVVDDTHGFQSIGDRQTIDVEDIITIHYMRENPGLSGLNEPLDQISYEHFERLFEGSVPQGQPELYTKYAGQIGIWPTPAAEYPLYWSGVVRPQVPVADDDDSVWFRNQRELIENAAAARVCAKYLRNTEWANTFKALEQEEYDVFQTEYAQQSGTSRIKTSL